MSAQQPGTGVAGSGGQRCGAVVDPVTGNAVPEHIAQLVSRQLGRPARGTLAVAHQCACGCPDVVVTAPRLPDGTPFPTLYYLTCPAASSAVSRLEAQGWMRTWQQQLHDDFPFAAAYQQAHEHYLRERLRYGAVPELDQVSAGGMPQRVKCLHALVAHSLAAGPGVNPVGDAALEQLDLVGQGPSACWGVAQCCQRFAAQIAAEASAPGSAQSMGGQGQDTKPSEQHK